MSDKDINHTIRFYFHKYRRLKRDTVNPHFVEFWHSLSDATNAIMRGFLSLFALFFSTLADICNRWKEKCYRESKTENKVFFN